MKYEIDETNGGPAHPIIVETTVFPGLTIRDWFAGQALAGLLAAGRDGEVMVTDEAYEYAAAMLEARK